MTDLLLGYLCVTATVIGVAVSVELHRSAHYRPRSLKLQRGYALAATELALRSRGGPVGLVAVRRDLEEAEGENGHSDLPHDLISTVRGGHA